MTIDDYVRENQQQFINLLANFVSQKSLSQTGEGIQATVLAGGENQGTGRFLPSDPGSGGLGQDRISP